MLRLLILLASCSTVSCLSCLWCQHYAVDTGDSSLDQLILAELGGSGDKCRDDPAMVNTYAFDCDTCNTIYITVNISAIVGNEEVSAEVAMVLRGCGGDEVRCSVTDEETTDMVNDELEAANIDMLTVTGMDGGQCSCAEEECNTHVQDDIPTLDDVTSCVSCGWVNSETKTEALKNRLPTSTITRKCKSNPDEITPKPCDLDEICTSLMVDVKSFDGIEARATLTRRCCVNKEVLSHTEEGCHRADDFMDQVDELLGTDDYMAKSAGICFCEGNGCNTETPDQLVGAAESVKCTSCKWVEAESKVNRILTRMPGENDDVMCKENPDELEPEFCNADQVCASLRMEVNSFEGIYVPATLWYRGCVDVDALDEVEDDCYNITGVPDQVAAVLATADYVATGGAVCFCGYDVCNVETERELEEESGLGPECHICTFARHSDSDISSALKQEMDDTSSKCRQTDQISDTTIRRCSVDETCYSLKVALSSHNGDDVEGADVWYRGCVSKDLVEELEEGCFPALNHMDVVRELISDTFEVSEEEGGGVCRCDGNLCNTYPSSTMNAGADLTRCISCSYVEVEKGKRKYNKKLPAKEKMDCRDDPEEFEPTYCSTPSETCASLIIDVTSYAGLDERPARLVRRCCVEKEPVHNITGCHHASMYPAQVEDLLDTDDYDAMSGGICFCHEDGCNTESKKIIWEASGANKCLMSCKGYRNGSYNKCFSCRDYMVCWGGRTTNKRCKRGKEFDSDKGKCVRNSATCPVTPQ